MIDNPISYYTPNPGSMLDIDVGFSTIYDPNLLRSNNLFNTYGLGSLIRIYDIPVSSLEPNIDFDVKPSLNVTKYAKYFSSSNPFYVIEDKSFWVILPSISINKEDTAARTISLTNAIDNYRRYGAHFGKFKSQKYAVAAARTIEGFFETVQDREYGGPISRSFGPFVTSLNVSYSIDGANEINFTVIDKNYDMMEKNYFAARRLIRYRGDKYEIGAVQVGPGPGGSPQVTVTAWNEAVQQMKRDKKPSSISGSSVYEYAMNAANKFGLKFVAQKPNKAQTINKGTNGNSDESVWSVLQSAANQDEFVMYVMDGTLVYGSEQWLLWKFGTDQKTTTDKAKPIKKYSRLYFNPGEKLPDDASKFEVLEWPSIRQSENDPREGDGSILVAKPNGCVIRPGNTVIIGPKPTLFQGGYLVSEVSFSEATNEPVQISFRTPEKPKKQKKV